MMMALGGNSLRPGRVVQYARALNASYVKVRLQSAAYVCGKHALSLPALLRRARHLSLLSMKMASSGNSLRTGRIVQYARALNASYVKVSLYTAAIAAAAGCCGDCCNLQYACASYAQVRLCI
jgi:hypothetical protein